MLPNELSRDDLIQILTYCELFNEYHNLEESDNENYVYFRNTETNQLIEFEIGTSIFELINKSVYIYYQVGREKGMDDIRSQIQILLKLAPDSNWQHKNK